MLTRVSNLATYDGTTIINEDRKEGKMLKRT